MKGSANSSIQTGCVHSCSAEMRVTPRITNGMITSDDARYSAGSGQSR